LLLNIVHKRYLLDYWLISRVRVLAVEVVIVRVIYHYLRQDIDIVLDCYSIERRHLRVSTLDEIEHFEYRLLIIHDAYVLQLFYVFLHLFVSRMCLFQFTFDGINSNASVENDN
jgi:hypothetical protein